MIILYIYFIIKLQNQLKCGHTHTQTQMRGWVLEISAYKLKLCINILLLQLINLRVSLYIHLSLNIRVEWKDMVGRREGKGVCM